MSNYPDFSSHGYQVIRELGCNRESGRITYLAVAPNATQQVVIKEFRFALAGASWSGFKAYQREIEILQQLDHPRIPRYLDSFETPQGFCLVQEYKNAPSLAQRRTYYPEQIKQIALSVLEILADLQKRTPPVIHRDIKPENILVDKQLKAYLIDFGFARIRGGELALSSVAAGTPGFMPPEEMFNRPLSEASDLYSLGVTLICLLSGSRSVDVGKLMDEEYRFNFKKLLPKLNPRFLDWLSKMVAPNVKQRFPNAAAALAALKPIPVKGSAKKSAIAAGLGLAALSILVLAGATFTSLRQKAPAKQSPPPEPEVTPVPVKQVPETKFTLCHTRQFTTTNTREIQQLLATKTCPGCNLQNAGLVFAQIIEANLTEADLERAQLVSANLWRSDLTFANLKCAILERANLGESHMAGANLERALMWGTRLDKAFLHRANLAGAELYEAVLEGANLQTANLEGAKLEGANLRNANLRYANLKGAILLNADLNGANLDYANLEGANLFGAKVNSSQLKNARLKGAIAPDGSKRE